jgi:hypothetical protein
MNEQEKAVKKREIPFPSQRITQTRNVFGKESHPKNHRSVK